LSLAHVALGMEGGTPTIGEALCLYLDDLSLAAPAPTVKAKRALLKPLRGSTEPLSAFDGTLVRALVRDRLGGTNATAVAVCAHLSAFGSWLVDQGWLRENPAKGVPRPKIRRKPHRWLRPEELRRLWAAACELDECSSKDALVADESLRCRCIVDVHRPHIRNSPECEPDLLCDKDEGSPRGEDTTNRLLVLLLMQGLRSAELLGLRWCDVQWERGEIMVVRTKGGKPRRTPLTDDVRALLTAGDLPICPHRPKAVDGIEPPSPALRAQQPYSTTRILPYGPHWLATRCKKLGDLAGIPHVHAHLWRHSWASNALKEGMSMADVQTLGGWAKDDLVRRTYAASVMEDVALDAARKLDLAARLFGSEAP